MSAIRQAWNGWWFKPVPLRRLGLFRIVIAGAALVDMALFSHWFTRYVGVDAEFSDPVYLVRPLMGLDITAGMAAVLYGILLLALAAAAAGFKTRPALFTSATLFLFFNALFNSFHKVNHGKISLVVALFALSLAPSGATYSVDAWRRARDRGHSSNEDSSSSVELLDPVAGWVFRAVAVTVVIHYVAAAIGKLWLTGPSWITEPVMRTALIGEPGPLAAWAQQQTVLLEIAQGFTLVLEFVAVLLLFKGGWVRNVLLLLLFGFHMTATLLLGVEFWGLIAAWTCFFALEEGVDRVKAYLADRTAPSAQAQHHPSYPGARMNRDPVARDTSPSGS